MSEDDLAASAASAPALRQVTALTRWVGGGRKLTQTGQLAMADARHLVGLLDTGDEIDPVLGERVFRTRSSADLPVLAIVVTWAKAAGLVRVVHGRLVPVRKNQRLIDRPAQLWNVMFTAFNQLGPAICPSGWFPSLLGDNFADGTAVLFGGIADGGGAAPTAAVEEEVWSALSVRYYLDEATDEQLGRLRKTTDHDVRRAVAGLVALAEKEAAAGMLRLTPLAEWALRSRYGAVAPGDQIARLKVTLLDTDPPVWRRLLVPATIRLDRLDRVVQAAMGWTNSHLHMFIHPAAATASPTLTSRWRTNAASPCATWSIERVKPSGTSTTSAMDGNTRSCSSSCWPPSPAAGTPPVWLAHAPAHRKTAAVPTATPTSSTHLPSPATPNISICWNGSASRKAVTSTRCISTPPTPTADSTPSYSPRPAPPDQGSAAGVGRARGRNSVRPAADTAQSENTPRTGLAVEFTRRRPLAARVEMPGRRRPGPMPNPAGC